MRDVFFYWCLYKSTQFEPVELGSQRVTKQMRESNSFLYVGVAFKMFSMINEIFFVTLC